MRGGKSLHSSTAHEADLYAGLMHHVRDQN